MHKYLIGLRGICHTINKSGLVHRSERGAHRFFQSAGKMIQERKSKHCRTKIPKRNCIICGTVYEPKSPNSITCSDICRKKRYKQIQEAANKKMKAKRNAEKILKKLREQESKDKLSPLAEKNEKARELGMTYGQYDAYLWRQNQKRTSRLANFH